jgi:hypothetical protein
MAKSASSQAVEQLPLGLILLVAVCRASDRPGRSSAGGPLGDGLDRLGQAAHPAAAAADQEPLSR